MNELERLTNITAKEILGGGYKFYIMKYTSSNYEQWFNQISTLGYSTVIPEADIKELGKYNASCVQLDVEFICPSGLHNGSTIDECDYPLIDWSFSYVLTPKDCIGGGGSSPSGSHGGGGNNPIASVPIPCSICPIQSETISDTPCEQLKEITDNSSIMSDVNQLKPKTQTEQESAIAIERKYNAEEGVFKNSVGIGSNGTHFSTKTPTGRFNIANAHNHPIDGQSIPSWGDVKWLRECENNIRTSFQGLGLSTNIVIVSDSEVPTNNPIIYAAKVNDIIKLNNQINSDLTNIPSVMAIPDENLKIDKMNDIYGQFYKNTQNNTTGLEKKILELFQNYGISLYKYNSNSDTWSKLSLLNQYNPLNPDAINPVISKPCNQ